MPLNRDQSAGYLANWAARLFARAIDRRLRPMGVAAGQLPVFFALAEGQALTQSALAEHAAIEQPTMAATLNRMERDGLIQRQRNPGDGRSALVSLTPRGLALAPLLRAELRAVNAQALSGLAPAEAEAFLALLRRVIAGLEARDAQAVLEPPG